MPTGLFFLRLWRQNSIRCFQPSFMTRNAKNLGSLTNVLFVKLLEVESFLVWLPVVIIEVPDDASLFLSSLLFSLFACRRFPEKSGDKRSFRLFLFFLGIRGMEGGTYRCRSVKKFLSVTSKFCRSFFFATPCWHSPNISLRYGYLFSSFLFFLHSRRGKWGTHS